MRSVSAAFTLMAVVLVCSAAIAEEIPVQISIDDEIALDANVIVDVVETTADGAEMSRAVRGIAARTVAELRLALEERISEGNLLTLDDGTTKSLLDGDAVIVEMVHWNQIGACRWTKGQPGAYTCGSIQFQMHCPIGKKCKPGAVAISFYVDQPQQSDVLACKMGMSLPPQRTFMQWVGLHCY